MKTFLPRLGLLAVIGSVGILGLSGCGSMGIACTANIQPGVFVEVRDARTGQPAADGATATVQDGTYTDTLRPGSYDRNNVLLGFQGADERPGTYTVRVTKPGYTAFEQTGVRVTGGDCHVTPASVRADLVPTP